MKMPVVERISLVKIIFLFVAGVITHIAFGYQAEKFKKLKNDNPNDEKIIKNEKIVRNIFRWFPVVYVILIIVMFYLGV